MPKREPKPIPRTLFHGTLTKYVPSIRESGLRVSTVGVHPGFEQDVEGCLFVAEAEKDARFFGIATAIDKGEPEIDFTVLVIDRFKAEIAGVSFFEPQGRLDPKAFRGRQFVACQTIPPEAIVGYVRVYTDPVTGRVKEERGDFDRDAEYRPQVARRSGRGDQVFVRKHGRKIGVYPGGKYYRERVMEPSECQPGSMRTIDIGREGGHKAVVCRPRGSRKTRTQSILHPRTERERKKLGLPKRVRRSR